MPFTKRRRTKRKNEQAKAKNRKHLKGILRICPTHTQRKAFKAAFCALRHCCHVHNVLTYVKFPSAFLVIPVGNTPNSTPPISAEYTTQKARISRIKFITYFYFRNWSIDHTHKHSAQTQITNKHTETRAAKYCARTHTHVNIIMFPYGKSSKIYLK